MWHRMNGVFLLIASAAVGGLGYMVLSLLAQALRENPEAAKDIPESAIALLRHRGLLVPMIIPSIAGGFLLIFSSRTGGWRWAVFAASLLWVVALVVAVLYAFVSFLAPLYQYQAL